MIVTSAPTSTSRVTDPATVPVSLAEAKAHLRVDGSDEDTLIAALVDAAVEHFDGTGTLGKAIITQTWADWFAPAPGNARLRIGPFVSLTSVEYYDEDNALQTATLGNFETWQVGDFVVVKPKPDNAWPTGYSRPDAFKVTYVAGFGSASDVPATIKQAILLTVAHWYEHRMAVDDVKMSELPFAVEALIGNERAGWYG